MTVPLPGVPVAEHREWLREIADLGYTDAWTMETDGLDAFTPLAITEAWAPELRLGTAIASVFARGPALLAQTAAGLAEAAPARFVLGIGASSETMVRGWNGIPFEAPYATWGVWGWSMAWEPVSTIEPPPPFFMTGATARARRTGPTTLVS